MLQYCHMMTWAKKRQLIYLSIFLTIAVLVFGTLFFVLWYQKPTCFDGKQNGDEEGVDCGGSCVKICKAMEIRPVVLWQRAFLVKPGVYNAVAYIQNPNINAEVLYERYVFTFRDENNTIIATTSGATFIPAGKNFAVFAGGVPIPAQTQTVLTSFEFVGDLNWTVAPAEKVQLQVKNQQTSDLQSKPVINADIYNSSQTNLGRVNATAIVYDTDGNAVAASKTYIDSLGKTSTAHVVFTWPEPFPAQVSSCQQPVDIMLAIDRSGSMASDGQNPPEPMTSVKNSALAFVDALKTKDRAGLVSFATAASNPVDQSLTEDHDAVKDSIRSINIEQGSVQYTNISDALTRSLVELENDSLGSSTKRAIVLLTDGKPTYPEKKGDSNFPADSALAVSRQAQTQSVEIYTIGLGKDIDEDFLKSVSGFTERFYRAPTKSDLDGAYAQIGSALCKLGPAKVEIIPDVLP